MKASRGIALLVALTLAAAACGAGEEAATTTTATTTSEPGVTTTQPPPTTDGPQGRTEDFTPGEVIRLQLPRTTPAVSGGDVAAVVAGDRALGLDLLRVTAGDENVMVSPYSIATALAMLYPGARGATATEIASVLHLSVDDPLLHAVRGHIDALLATPPPPIDDRDTREPFTIRPANSAWGQGGYPFLDDYLRVLAESYGAGLRLVDYVRDPDGSRRLINEWVENATEDRIKDLVPESAVDADTRLALVNAVWFKANWQQKFDPAATAPGTFTLLDGTTAQVPLMHAGIRTGYTATDTFEAVRLPYAGDAAMIVMLPRSGAPAELAASLTPADLDITWGDYRVDVTLPPFEFEAEINLKEALIDLGMRKAFEFPSQDGADFTGITAIRELYVSGAFHKTFIALDEDGTEAAAATAIIVSRESAPPPATFTADRPFLFWIEHSTTGEMLFLGQVTDPR